AAGRGALPPRARDRRGARGRARHARRDPRPHGRREPPDFARRPLHEHHDVERRSRGGEPVNLRSLALPLSPPSLQHRLRTQARRLRQPKYLVATSLGALYWWWYVGRRFFGLPPPHFDSRLRTLLEVALTLLGIVTVAFYWVFGSERGALKFSEAEVQF